MMNTVVCRAPGVLVLERQEIPVRGPGEVLLRVRRVGICGTDMHIFRGTQPYLAYPRVMGHELAGEVADADPACGLKHGIYAVRVGIGAKRYDGVASFGRRPTFDNGAPLLEVFLFGFSGDLYGQTMDVALIGWIRPEEKFGSVEALMAQMSLDAARAREALARNPSAFPPLGEI